MPIYDCFSTGMRYGRCAHRYVKPLGYLNPRSVLLKACLEVPEASEAAGLAKQFGIISRRVRRSNVAKNTV